MKKQIVYKNKPIALIMSLFLNCLIKIILHETTYFYLIINTFLFAIILQYILNTIEFKNILKNDQMKVQFLFWPIRIYFTPIIYIISCIAYNFINLDSAIKKVEFINLYGILFLILSFSPLLRIEIPLCIGKSKVIINKQVISIKSISSIEGKPVKNNNKSIKVMIKTEEDDIETYYIESVISNDSYNKLISLYNSKSA